jgi:hypothetical protein
MNKLISLLTVSAMMVCNTVKSQTQDSKLIAHVALGSPLMQTEKELASFETSYANYWSSQVKTPFHHTGIAYNLEYGIGYQFSPNHFFDLTQRIAKNERTIEFENGDTRQLSFTYRSLFELTWLMGNPQRFQIGPRLGVTSSHFTSMYIDSNGIKDIGTSSSLNGTYSAFGFSYGLDLKIHLFKNLALQAYYWKVKGSEYRDQSFLKGIDSNSSYEISQFPSDYQHYMSTVGSGESFNFEMEKMAHQHYRSLGVQLSYTIVLL